MTSLTNNLTGAGYDMRPPAKQMASPLSAGLELVTAATSGWSSGWMPAYAFGERFAFRPAGISGTASVSIEGSLDGVTSTQAIGVMAMTNSDNGLQNYTPPLNVGYPFVRIVVVSDGGGTHTIARGV